MTGYFGGYGDNYDPAMRPAEIQAGRDIAAVAAASGASLIAQTIYADSAPAHALRAGGVAVYRNVEDAGWALARLATRAACSRRGVPEPGIEAAPLIDTGYWPARRALAAAGVPFGRAAEVATLSELRDAAAGLRFPLVLKALVDEHKSDRGGVVLGIADQAALERAWLDIQTRLAPPTVSVEEQLDLSEAVELIVGVRRDPAFGPIVMVGLGGVHTELFGDIRCALGPVTTAVADELLRSLKGAALLTGFRGRPALAVDAAAALIVALSRFADAHPELREVECNPVAVTRDAVVALDARIVLS